MLLLIRMIFVTLLGCLRALHFPGAGVNSTVWAASFPHYCSGSELIINISRFSGDQCRAASALLGLPELPANVKLVQRRQQIADHIGARYFGCDPFHYY